MRDTLSVAICVIVSLVLFVLGTRYIHGIWVFATFYNLQLHLALGSVAGLLLALLLKRKLFTCLLLAVAILFAGHAFFMTRQFSSVATAADADAPTFRLLSFNILMGNHESGADIAQLIVSSDADVVNIMEAEPLLAHLDKLATVYPYRIGCGVLVSGCDLMMLSKTPLMDGAVRSLSDIFGERFVIAKTVIRDRTINLGAIHTTKPYFDDFHTMELVRAALAITDTEGPFLLSGDFNASSIAPDMRMFMRWTDLRHGEDEPATWPIEAGTLGLPIDHIYVRAPLKVKTLKRLPDPLGSNHYGLIADIAITGN